MSNQTGAALGALAFPAIGPVGVVAVRQIVTALVLAPIVRPKFRGLGKAQWWPLLGLMLVFSVMNLSLYAAIDRIGIGLAVTLEFLGPLTVAIASSRRMLDIACAVLAGVGVVVLTDPGSGSGNSDLSGMGLALLAAAAWGCYILLNRTLGQRLPGLQGTAAASLLSAAAWTPIAAFWFAVHVPTAGALALAAVCGLMSSIVPYATDLLALRRVPTPLFGTFTSINPVWAALTGWLVLHQALRLNEWVGIGLIVVSNVVASARGWAVFADRPQDSAGPAQERPCREGHGRKTRTVPPAERSGGGTPFASAPADGAGSGADGRGGRRGGG
ncbi:EamA family transporter [Arthrobacter sp. NPDC089319]|uniref:EamA family transporter n=1 Tax=Arthrobacter sp. NPDC089319 TaxID=3155915 RepID=UPI00341FE626